MASNPHISKQLLDSLYDQFDVEAFKGADPCGVVYQLMEHTDNQADIEIGALLTAMISWGTRKVIVPTALHMLRDEMHWKPYQFIMNEEYEQSYTDAKNQCVYRTLNVPTFKAVCRNLHYNLKDYPTMEARLGGMTAKDAVGEICRWLEPAKVGTMDKSACKRVCMFLRWMVRKSAPDFGLWTTRTQDDLYAVMDTHVCALTKSIMAHKRPTWQACEELTSIFRSWNPVDPLRYDVALMVLADNISNSNQNQLQ